MLENGGCENVLQTSSMLIVIANKVCFREGIKALNNRLKNNQVCVNVEKFIKGAKPASLFTKLIRTSEKFLTKDALKLNRKTLNKL